MEPTKWLYENLKSFESCKLHAYRDITGVPTIGYGHTENVHIGQIITEEKAEELLKEDVEEFVDGVNKLVKVNLTSGEFDALVDFAYNLGLANLKKSTLLRKVNVKDFVGAAEEFAKWDSAGGKEVKGLLRRRIAEKARFVTKN